MLRLDYFHKYKIKIGINNDFIDDEQERILLFCNAYFVGFAIISVIHYTVQHTRSTRQSFFMVGTNAFCFPDVEKYNTF